MGRKRPPFVQEVAETHPKQKLEVWFQEKLSRLSWEFDLRPGDSGSTLRDSLLHVNGFA